MTAAPKVKVSLTLSRDLLDWIDRAAQETRDARSRVVEQWLRRVAHARAEEDLAARTVAYYRSLDPGDEDAALSRSLSRAARKLTIDERPAPPRQRRARTR
jgi:hypothetical protein